MRGRHHFLTLAFCLIASVAQPVRAQTPGPLFESWIGFDEDSDFATFLGHGVVMLAETGPAHPRQARVFSAQSGRLQRVLDCPPYDYSRGDDDPRQPCPTAVVASGRLFVLLGMNAMRVFARDGEFVRDIVVPPGLPWDLFHYGRNVAIRGRRIAVGGPDYDDSGKRVAGVVVRVFDAFSGRLVEEHRIAAPENYLNVAVAFAGRALVVSALGIGTPLPALVMAVDRRTGAPLWSRGVDSRFGAELVALGSDVVVGAEKLDGQTGEIEATYAAPPGRTYRSFGAIAAAGRRVVVANAGVHVFAAADGRLLETVTPPLDLCDLFGITVGVSASRLLVTSGSYCGSGHAFVYRRR